MKLLPLNKIKPDPDNPRKSYPIKTMESLERSVKEKGILNPLIVEDMGDGNYLLLDGERRFRTATKLKFKEVPVEIMEKMSPLDRMMRRFHIQEQHVSWSPFDKARAINYFMKNEGVSLDQTAQMLGIAKASVISWMGILQLSKNTEEQANENKVEWSYLQRIPRITKKFQEIVDMPKQEIESILIEKIGNGAIAKTEDMVRLNSIMNIEGSEQKKIKLLKDKNYSVRSLLVETPQGKSVDGVALIQSLSQVRGKLRKLVGWKNDYNENQEKVVRETIRGLEKLLGE